MPERTPEFSAVWAYTPIMLRFILADAGYWLSTGFVTDKNKLMKPIRSVLLDNQKLNELLAEGLVTKDAVEGSVAVSYRGN